MLREARDNLLPDFGIKNVDRIQSETGVLLRVGGCERRPGNDRNFGAVKAQKNFDGEGTKFGWKIKLIAQLRLLAVVHHRPSLFFPCHDTLDDVDPQRSQAAAIFDPPLENNRRVSSTIERIHPGIWRSSRPGKSPCNIQQFIVFYPLQARPTPTAVWAFAGEAKGPFITNHDDPNSQSAQFASETTTKEQEADNSDEHHQSQPHHGSACSK